MKICLDFSESSNNANMTVVGFEDWKSDKIAFSVNKTITISDLKDNVEKFSNELILLNHLSDFINPHNIELIIISDYVWLDNEKKIKGKGAFFYEFFNKNIPIIGVAQTCIENVSSITKIVFRGPTPDPIYITSAGIDEGFSAYMIRIMYGDERIPNIIQYTNKFAVSL